MFSCSVQILNHSLAARSYVAQECSQPISYSLNKIAFEVQRIDDQALYGPRYAVIVSD